MWLTCIVTGKFFKTIKKRKLIVSDLRGNLLSYDIDTLRYLVNYCCYTAILYELTVIK